MKLRLLCSRKSFASICHTRCLTLILCPKLHFPSTCYGRELVVLLMILARFYMRLRCRGRLVETKFYFIVDCLLCSVARLDRVAVFDAAARGARRLVWRDAVALGFVSREGCAGAFRPARVADAEVVELGHLVVLNILCRCGAAVCVVPAMCAPRSGA